MNEIQSGENESFESMLSELFPDKGVVEGKVVSGIIVDIKNNKAVIDIGLKTEGKILLSDIKALKGADEISVGDTLDVFIEKFEDKNGEPVLSVEKAQKDASWRGLEAHLTSGEPVDGVIASRTKGGYSVDINGTVAFLPGSQVDIRPVKDITPFLDVPHKFKILRMDKYRNNIVVSRRAIQEDERNEARTEIIAKLEEGAVVSGTVKNITEYGAFVDIGGIDGLLHVTEMSWERVVNPADIVQIGDVIQVQIIKFSKETGRISLGLKQLTKSPWDGVVEKYEIGMKCKGEVVNMTDYGVFVRLEKGIEGMIYMTDLSWIRKDIHPSKVVSPGDEVEVVVLDVNMAKRKISLGLKQCQENPWQKFADENPVGTKLQGVVKNMTEFGIFVAVDDALDGMVHISNLSWNPDAIDDKALEIQVGQTIDVVVLDVNPEKERISLGIKQLENDPHAGAIADINKDDVVTATITDVSANGAEVVLDSGLPGFIRKGDFSINKTDQQSGKLEVGDKVEACVTAIDKAARRVGLSIKVLEARREKERLEEFGSTGGDGSSNLGDMIEAAIKDK
jgi:small subunit ribosomal protein S1